MRLYYGWFIVFASLVILTGVLGTTVHSFGVFVRPVSEDMGLSRADTNTGLILFSLGGAVWAPIMGKLLDRLAIRPIMLICAVIMGASFIALSFSRSVMADAIILAGPLALAAQGAGTITATTIIARWFTVYRARAMAIALFGMSLAGVVVTPAIAYGVQHFEWRPTLMTVGASLTLVLLLLGVFIVRGKPGANDVESHEPNAVAAAQAASDAKPLKALTLLLMPQFWTIGLSCAVTLGFAQATMVTLVPLAEGIGIDATQAASLIAILSAAGLVGGLLTAWLADKIDRMTLITILFLFVAAAGAVLYFSHSFPMLAAGAVVLGFTTGIVSPAFHALIADRFGPASFGTAYGLMVFLMTIMGAVCVRYAGEVFDRTGAYDNMFLTIVVVGIVAALVMWATKMLSAPPAGVQPASVSAH